MRTFDELKIVQTTFLWRNANVSATVGNRVIDELERHDMICPERTPTGRTVLSIREAQLVFGRIHGDVIAA